MNKSTEECPSFIKWADKSSLLLHAIVNIDLSTTIPMVQKNLRKATGIISAPYSDQTKSRALSSHRRSKCISLYTLFGRLDRSLSYQLIMRSIDIVSKRYTNIYEYRADPSEGASYLLGNGGLLYTSTFSEVIALDMRPILYSSKIEDFFFIFF